MTTSGACEVIARAVILDDGGRALLARAQGAANAFLPGGHVELGESVVDGLRREIFEELGLECAIGAPLGVVEHRWTDGARDRFEINHVFRARVDLPGSPTSREAALSFSWCSLDALDAQNLQPEPARAIVRMAAAGPVGERAAARVHECTFSTPRECVVRHVRADDVERLKHARLYALAETPSAFGATLARDLAMSDERWLAWAEQRGAAGDARARATFVADDGDALRGTITVLAEGEPGEERRALIVAMWVHAAHRGLASRPLARRLLDEGLAWARAQGISTASLAVTSTNARARRFYERAGFALTGEQQPLAHTPSLVEQTMIRALG